MQSFDVLERHISGNDVYQDLTVSGNAFPEIVIVGVT
jgi:hypothetical protein